MEHLGLAGRIALVTGAGGLIGGAICSALARDGATVIATDIVRRPGIEPLDVTSAAAWGAVMDEIATRHGALDILVNNAAIAPVSSIEDLTLEGWRSVQAVNVESALLGMKAGLPLLRRADARPGGASIVNLASAAANRASSFTAAYSASKATLVMLSKTAAVEFASLGYAVRVNTVNPGAVDSPMLTEIAHAQAKLLDTSFKAVEAGLSGDIPMGRLTRADDVAEAVAWLASSGSRFVTGTELHVDGGYTAR